MTDFKSGDKVFWDKGGEKQPRVVSHVIGDEVWFTNGFFVLRGSVFLEKDDEIPPVPTNVRYECSYHPGEDFLQLENSRDFSMIVIRVRESNCVSNIVLSPETALDLAADLTRMALKLKREQESEE